MARPKTNNDATLELPYEVIAKAAGRDEVRAALKEDGGTAARSTYMIPLKKILIRDGFNVRYDMGDVESLAKDILENGLLNPLNLDLVIVGKKRKWYLEAGHRRREALALIDKWGEFKKLNKQGIRDGCVECFINSAATTELDRIVRLFSSNHAKELTALEVAEVVRRLEEYFGKTHAQIAEILGCSRQQVDNYAILYKLDDQTKQSIKNGNLTPTEAVAKAREVKKKQKEASDKNQKGTSSKAGAGQENEHKIRTAGETIDENEFGGDTGNSQVYGGFEDDGEEVFPFDQNEEEEPETVVAGDGEKTNMQKQYESGRPVEISNKDAERFISNSNPEAENKEEYQLCNRVIQNSDKVYAMCDKLADGAIAADMQRLLGFIVKDMEVIREYVKKCRK